MLKSGGVLYIKNVILYSYHQTSKETKAIPTAMKPILTGRRNFKI